MVPNQPVSGSERDLYENELTVEWRKFRMGDEPVTLRTRSGGLIVKIIAEQDGVMLHFPNGQMSLSIGEQIKIGREFQHGYFGDREKIISGHHCEIRVDKEGGDLKIWIRDLESTNGTCYEIEEENDTGAVTLAGGQEGIESAQNGDFQILTYMSGGKLKGYRVNEDSAYMNPGKKVVAVADGMGGYGHGEKASQIVIDSVNSGVREELDPNIIIRQAVTRLGSNQKLAGSNYGATLAMARAYKDEHGRTMVECCHVGDAAIYVIHPTEGLKYVSKDQSWVQRMIDGGILGRKSRYTHDRNSEVSNAIQPKGLKSDPKIEHIQVTPGTVVLVVSDGISDFVTPEEVTEMVMEHGKDAPKALKALAESRYNEEGGFKFKLDGKEEQSPLDGGDNIAIGFMYIN